MNNVIKAVWCCGKGLVALLAVVWMGCGGNADPENSGDGSTGNDAGNEGRLKVTATVNMVGDLARQVGGEHVVVTELMGPGVDPHLYKATQGDLLKLQKADIVFYVGLHLEGKIQDTLEKMDKQAGKSTVAVSKTIDHKQLLRDPGAVEFPDPHIWFDVLLWLQTVDAMVEGLSQADPKHKADYEKNGATTKAGMQKLHEWAAAKITELPVEKRILVTSHDAYNYFGNQYGFKVVGLQGISTVGEAGLADLTKLVDFIKQQKVKAIFVENSVSPDAIKRIATDAGVVVGGELFSDAMGERGKMEGATGAQYDVGTYEGMIRHNINTIVDALK